LSVPFQVQLSIVQHAKIVLISLMGIASSG